MKDSPIRLLYVLEQTHISNQLYGLFSYFQKQGLEVIVFNFDSNPEFKSQVSNLIHDYQNLEFGKSYWKSIFKLNKLVKELKPHIVHANEFIPAFYTGFLFKRRGLKTIYHRRHNYTPGGLVQFMDQWAVMRADKVVAVCETMKEVAQNEHPFYKNKIIARTNAITIGFKHEATFETEKRTIERLPENFTILLLARLRPGKGHRIALDVVNELITSGYDVQLIIVGDGPDRERIESMVHKSNVGKNTHFVGNFDNVELAVRNADVMLVPSDMEAFPKTPLEAMAYGCPVIAHSVGGIVEAVEDGVNGFLVDKGDVKQFVEKVKLIYDDTELKKSIIERGEETVKSRYVVEIMASEMIDLYRSLTRNN